MFLSMSTKMQMSWKNGNLSLDGSWFMIYWNSHPLEFKLCNLFLCFCLLFCFGPNFPIDFANGTLPNWITSPHLDEYHFFPFLTNRKNNKEPYKWGDSSINPNLPTLSSHYCIRCPSIAEHRNLPLPKILFGSGPVTKGHQCLKMINKNKCLLQYTVKCSYFVIS